MSTRAAVVVTGTEVLTGRVADRNGSWLAEQLRVLGVDIGQVIIVGDRPDDLRGALEYLGRTGVELIITSGGLGPTADDVTAEVVGAVQGRPSELDEELERRIAGIVERLGAARGWRRDPQATAAGVRKQAMVPAGATVLEPIGTAPGLIVPVADGRSGAPVVVLPGPPRELQPMWRAAVENPLVQAALTGREELRQQTIRIWDVPESELAETLRRTEREMGAEFGRLEITTCLRTGELEIVTRYGPSAQDAYRQLRDAILAAHGDTVFSPDGRTIDEIVADELRARGMTIATAESCTAGLVAGRLTDLAGSSDYVLGGLVTYSNQAKHELLGVPQELLDTVGAVSAEVAEAMAAGARERVGADVGVGITGIAGPGGGSADKPVGLVHFCASTAERALPARVVIPGSRADVRARSVMIAMHLIRRLVQGVI
jgi:nicotinamide-nucleotide amidase